MTCKIIKAGQSDVIGQLFRYEFGDVRGLESETDSGDYIPHHLLVADFRSKTDHVVIIVEDIV